MNSSIKKLIMKRGQSTIGKLIQSKDYLARIIKDNHRWGYDYYKKRYETRPIQLGNDNPGISFFLIVNNHNNIGPFERWIENAFYILYAEQNGFIPYVCDANWKYYFSQPQDSYSFEEICRSRDVRLGGNNLGVCSYNTNWYPYASIFFVKLRTIYHELFTRTSPKDQIEEIVSKMIIPPRTLAIPMRRSFERGRLLNVELYEGWYGHHQLGFVDDYLRWGNKMLASGEFDYLFIAEVDSETVDLFEREFGERSIFLDRRRIHMFHNGEPVPDDSDYLFEEFEKMNTNTRSLVISQDYIAETILMSKCDAILNSPTSNVLMARIISENDIPVFDNYISLHMYK